MIGAIMILSTVVAMAPPLANTQVVAAMDVQKADTGPLPEGPLGAQGPILQGPLPEPGIGPRTPEKDPEDLGPRTLPDVPGPRSKPEKGPDTTDLKPRESGPRPEEKDDDEEKKPPPPDFSCSNDADCASKGMVCLGPLDEMRCTWCGQPNLLEINCPCGGDEKMCKEGLDCQEIPEVIGALCRNAE